MTTSNSKNFEIDVAEYIEEAFERCGQEVRTGYDLRTAKRSLNLLFADWANRGLNMWTVTQATTSIVSGTATYSFDATYVDLLEVVLRNSSGTDFTLSQMSRSEYLTIPNKASTGQPSQYFFDRQTIPTITLWSTPDASYTLVYYFVSRIQDADSLVNNADTPFRFLPCMVAGLAYYLAMKRAPERVQLLKSVYEEEFQRAAAEDANSTPLKLTPSMTYYSY